jgi:hypothetical protein
VARLDVRHWLVATGDTWASIALAAGVSRSALLLANGKTTGTAPLVGEVVHIPLAGT